ncbi:unnamed protein product [Diatraea saccharalis]|uniref:C3H1-type domain-containing protein n=3 Tax=Obtectomera TaxID=104431 RepID=A0A9N9QZ92_9NEOP|nr:unnamed protein product [Diatraea saccharalis]
MPSESKPSLVAQTEKPNHYKYLKEFRVEQCPSFLQHKCTQHRPFTCFHWHFNNQRRRRPVRKRDGTFNYSADNYCTKYNETSGICEDGDDCPYLHRTAGDTERRYHLRYYKTCMCVHDTDARGLCTKNGAHCAFAHGAPDLRPPVLDMRELQALENPDGADGDAAIPNALDRERNLMNEDPKWQDTNYVLSSYKTEPCKRPPRLCRQGYACPQYHNSKDKRRSPRKYKYRSTPCPNVKHGEEWGEPSNCEAGDACGYCHTRTEQQFHPEIYKSTKCNDVQQAGYCPRGLFCAFAHVERKHSDPDFVFHCSVSHRAHLLIFCYFHGSRRFDGRPRARGPSRMRNQSGGPAVVRAAARQEGERHRRGHADLRPRRAAALPARPAADQRQRRGLRVRVHLQRRVQRGPRARPAAARPRAPRALRRAGRAQERAPALRLDAARLHLRRDRPAGGGRERARRHAPGGPAQPGGGAGPRPVRRGGAARRVGARQHPAGAADAARVQPARRRLAAAAVPALRPERHRAAVQLARDQGGQLRRGGRGAVRLRGHLALGARGAVAAAGGGGRVARRRRPLGRAHRAGALRVRGVAARVRRGAAQGRARRAAARRGARARDDAAARAGHGARGRDGRDGRGGRGRRAARAARAAADDAEGDAGAGARGAGGDREGAVPGDGHQVHGVRGAAAQRDAGAVQPLRAVRRVRGPGQGVPLLPDARAAPRLGSCPATNTCFGLAEVKCTPLIFL